MWLVPEKNKMFLYVCIVQFLIKLLGEASFIWASTRENLSSGGGGGGGLRTTQAQTDQRLCYSLTEKNHI